MYSGEGYQECFYCNRACLYYKLNTKIINRFQQDVIDYNKNMYFGCKYCTCNVCSYPLDIKLYFDYNGVYKRNIICKTCNEYKIFYKSKLILKCINKQFNRLLNDKCLDYEKNNLLNGIKIINFINIIKLII